MPVFSLTQIRTKVKQSMKDIPGIFLMPLIPIVPFVLLGLYYQFHFDFWEIIDFLFFIDNSPSFLFAKVALALLGLIPVFFCLSIQYRLIPIVRGSQETVSYLDAFRIFKHPQFASIFSTYLIRTLLLSLTFLIFIFAYCVLLLSPFIIVLSLIAGISNPTGVGFILVIIVLGLEGFALLIFIPFNYNYFLIDMILYDQLETGTYTGPLAVFEESALLMKDYKKQAINFDIRLIGLLILTGITFGIAGFYTIPYIKLSRIHFYQAVLEDRQNKQLLETKS